MWTRQRTAALLEVCGVYLTGAYLNDRITQFLIDRHLLSPVNPFDLLTAHTSNGQLLLASRQLFLALVLIYGSSFLLIIPINCWNGQKGRAAYGLTRAGLPWKILLAAAVGTAALTQWPVLAHTLVDAVHPLGRMAPWRQGYFDMSWHRWQFWLFAGILSYAVIPILEELQFRGYYQRRLAREWGDGPAILGTACLFTFSHKQYLIANAYNVTMVMSLFCVALGLGIVFAWTRSLIPSIIAHAIINIPMTPAWQGVLLITFAIIAFVASRRGLNAARQVFANARVAACIALAVLGTAYAIATQRIDAMTQIAMGMLVVALALEAYDRRGKNKARTAGMPSAVE